MSKAVARFVRQLSESQLLTPAQLDEVNAFPSSQGEDFNALAKDIFKRGWLTKFQLSEIANGRGRDLNIGPYRLLELLGQGGMGQVFKAFHAPMSRIVALKVIRKERLGNENAVKRFHREIQTAAQLSHPNVVVAFDAGQVGSKLYFAMEYVDGIDLAELLARSGPLPVAQACDFIRQAALGLQHAHERGMIHRDIKPHNLMATRLPTKDAAMKADPNRAAVVKILDLGLARAKGGDEEAASVTQDGQGLGTPAYLAPEQARNARGVDIRADIYSLGCTFYHLLTGHAPFKGEIAEVLLKHQADEPEPVETVRPDVPASVALILRKMMAKKPEDRFQTPAEVAEALSEVKAPTTRGGKVNSDLNWTSLLDSRSDFDTPSSGDVLDKKTKVSKKASTAKVLAGLAGDYNVSLLIALGVAGVLVLGAALFGVRHLLGPKPAPPSNQTSQETNTATTKDPNKNTRSAETKTPDKEKEPVKEVKQPPPAKEEVVILDDAGPHFSTEGKWDKQTGAGFYGKTAHVAPKGDAKQYATASWTHEVPKPGIYEVWVTWFPSPDLAFLAPFRVLDDKLVIGSAAVGQQARPDNDIKGVSWTSLGRFLVTSKKLTVQLSSFPATGKVQADAVRFERKGELTNKGPAVQVLGESGEISSSGGVDFGKTSVGRPVVKEITIRNVGTAELQLGKIVMPSGMALISNALSALAPGAATTFKVEFDAKRSVNGQVTFSTNDPNHNPFSFGVRGQLGAAGP
jgi:serine/threonine-protein kinase